MFILFSKDGSSLPDCSDEQDLPCINSSLASASVFAAIASSSCLLRFSTSTQSIFGLSRKKLEHDLNIIRMRQLHTF